MESLAFRFETPDTYAVWSKDKNVRYNSTSGGAFTEFAKLIISKGGVVVGARYNKNNLVEHVIVDDYKGIELIRQSKYMSSSMGETYKKVKETLIAGKLVGFCGSPCQVAGLYSFLGKEYDNLFTMDFICRGMNSPKAFKAWLDEVERQEKCQCIRVWFKYKEGGWKTSPRRTRLDFANRSYKIYEGEKNLYMHGYLTSNLYIRPCCGNCRFKGIPRKSDVTFADFWGIEQQLDDDRGTSMLLINSEKGREFFEQVKNSMEVHQRNFDDILAGNPMFSTSANVPENGHEFLADLDNLSFSDCMKKYGGYPTPTPLWRKCGSKVKRVVKRLMKG